MLAKGPEGHLKPQHFRLTYPNIQKLLGIPRLSDSDLLQGEVREEGTLGSWLELPALMAELYPLFLPWPPSMGKTLSSASCHRYSLSGLCTAFR